MPSCGETWVRLLVTVQLMVDHDLDNRLQKNQLQAIRPSEVGCLKLYKTDLDEFVVWSGNDWMSFFNYSTSLFSPASKIFQMNFKYV